MCLLMSRTVPVFDLQLLLQQLVPSCVCVSMCEWENVNGRQRDRVMFKICRDRQRFCRQTERTSYSIAWLSQGKGRGGEKKGTKDLPYLSLYTRRPSFHWLMAHKWKQTLKEKMKNSLCLRPSDLPWHPAQTLLCCQRNGLLLSLQTGSH